MAIIEIDALHRVLEGVSNASDADLRRLAENIRAEVTERLHQTDSNGEDVVLPPTAQDVRDVVLVVSLEALATANETAAQFRKEFEAFKGEVRTRYLPRK